MDKQRFDALARGLGARASRREAIKWLGAAALGSAGISRFAGATLAQSTPGTYGDSCEMVEGSCRAPYTCFEAMCDLPRGCVGEGLPCVDDFPCCEDEGLTCVDGICVIPVETSLPATGIGVSMPHDTERVAGIALAGAAVVVAGKLIRDNESDPEL